MTKIISFSPNFIDHVWLQINLFNRTKYFQLIDKTHTIAWKSYKSRLKTPRSIQICKFIAGVNKMTTHFRQRISTHHFFFHAIIRLEFVDR